MRIGSSIGIAMSEGGGVTASALVRNADLALYAAKDAGRGVHRFYADAMHNQASERKAIEDGCAMRWRTTSCSCSINRSSM